MFTFKGTEYKSKSDCAKSMILKDPKMDNIRTVIADLLGIKYQTVHAIMKNIGVVPMARVKKTTDKKTTKVIKKVKKTAVKKTSKKVSSVIPAATEAVTPTQTSTEASA